MLTILSAQNRYSTSIRPDDLARWDTLLQQRLHMIVTGVRV